MSNPRPVSVDQEHELADIVDLERYPIHLSDDSDAAQEVVARHRDEMSANGVAVLAGFVIPSAMELIIAEANRLAPLGHFSETFSSPYLSAPDPSLPAGDPRSRSQRAALSAVAFDEFGSESLLVRLYESSVLREFLASVLGVDQLHSYADPLGAMSLAVMVDGDELGWHFDFSEFVVSLGIQSPTDGGTFDVVPRLRSADDPNDAAVIEVLDGDLDRVVTLPLEPGTLMIFAGRNSMHSVSPIHGGVERLVALLSYDTRPGTDSTDELKMVRYGRTSSRGAAGGALEAGGA